MITSRASLLALAARPRHDAGDGGGRTPDERPTSAAPKGRAPRARAVRDPPAWRTRRRAPRGSRGCRRVCSWRPISRFARTASSARFFGSRSSRSALVARERLAQVGLPLGRVAGPQPVEEALDSGSRRCVRRALVEVARELAARSPRTPSGCRARRRRSRRSNASNGVWSSAVRRPIRVSRLEEAAAQQPAPERRDRMQQPAAARRACARSARAGPHRGSSAPPAARPTSRTCTSSRPRRSAPQTPPRAASSSA